MPMSNFLKARISFDKPLLERDEDSHYMDNKDPCDKKIPEEETRESLIAISYTESQEDPPTDRSPDNLNDQNDVEAINGDGDEKYRSELISISYSQSPETQDLPPVLPGEHEG